MGKSVTATHQLLDAEEWTAQAADYRSRVDQFLAPHCERRGVGQSHPVWDFLFSYYSLRPGQLRCWHPGYGVVLAGDDAVRRYCGRRGYAADRDGVTVSDAYLRSRLDTLRYVARLLRATARRPARLNCFGLHEWAMVYRSDAVRHEWVPLRLSASLTDATVESMPLRCTHFDALRFFTAEAAPRNAGMPSRATQQDWEQPGCLHTNTKLLIRIAHMSHSALMSEAPTVLYLRESVDDLQGIDRHRVACRALCSARGWPVAREYVDNDRSAIKGTRPAYQQMLADIRAGRVGRIVAWDLDRL